VCRQGEKGNTKRGNGERMLAPGENERERKERKREKERGIK
jgi:hypothetical protein